MALKGARTIVVNGIPYGWKFAHASIRILGDAPVLGDIIVQGKGLRGRLRAEVHSTVEIDEYTQEHGGHKASVTPKDVRAVIEKGLADGWNPEARGQHDLKGPLKMAGYEVPA